MLYHELKGGMDGSRGRSRYWMIEPLARTYGVRDNRREAMGSVKPSERWHGDRAVVASIPRSTVNDAPTAVQVTTLGEVLARWRRASYWWLLSREDLARRVPATAGFIAGLGAEGGP